MILRNFARALAEQNWATVIVEIAVVVIGIFIGLQVDDWNRARQDRSDEQVFLDRLHEDVVRAEQLSSRVRQRRLERLQDFLGAGDVLFGRNARDTLTQEECDSIVWSSAYNIAIVGLPSVDALAATGRMGILSDGELRSSLVALGQAQAALESTLLVQVTTSNFVAIYSEHPDLVMLESYFDEDLGEMQSKNRCNVDAMRADQRFLNHFSANADGFDAFIRDGLAPWSAQLDKVHERVDGVLGITHEAREEPR